MSNTKRYLSAEEFDLMTEDQLNDYYNDMELDYQYEQYMLEKEAMETDYQKC